MWVWDQVAALFDYAQSHLALTLVAVFVGTLALSFLHASLTPPPKPAVYKCAATHDDAPLTCSACPCRRDAIGQHHRSGQAGRLRFSACMSACSVQARNPASM